MLFSDTIFGNSFKAPRQLFGTETSNPHSSGRWYCRDNRKDYFTGIEGPFNRGLKLKWVKKAKSMNYSKTVKHKDVPQALQITFDFYSFLLAILLPLSPQRTYKIFCFIS